MLPTRRRHGYVMDVVNMSDLNQSEGLRTLGVRISWDTLRGKLIYEVTSPPGSIRVLRGPMGQKVYLACYDVHLWEKLVNWSPPSAFPSLSTRPNLRGGSAEGAAETLGQESEARVVWLVPSSGAVDVMFWAPYPPGSELQAACDSCG